jgi:hypothetical protein
MIESQSTEISKTFAPSAKKEKPILFRPINLYMLPRDMHTNKPFTPVTPESMISVFEEFYNIKPKPKYKPGPLPAPSELYNFAKSVKITKRDWHPRMAALEVNLKY